MGLLSDTLQNSFKNKYGGYRTPAVPAVTNRPNDPQNKVGTTMGEFKNGQLKSSSGQIVTNPKQAVAIALSEKRRQAQGKY